MLIISFFSNNGIPQSGLTPIIDIADIDTDTLIIDGATMIALTSMPHVYIYNFTTYNSKKNYSITIDGGVTLSDTDRYQYAVNDSGNVKDDVLLIKQIETNRWQISNNNLIFYDDDNVTPLYIFALKDKDGNPTETKPYERVPV